jgi:hypothetical protein
MKTRIIIAVVGVAVVVIAAVQYRKQREKSLRQIQGTITSIDVASHMAAIEFVHPKSGQRFQLSGRVPPTCDIRINGEPATLADLKVGEQVRVEGSIDSSKRVVAKSVWVTRAPAPASAPAVSPAGQPASTTRPAGAP